MPSAYKPRRVIVHEGKHVGFHAPAAAGKDKHPGLYNPLVAPPDRLKKPAASPVVGGTRPWSGRTLKEADSDARTLLATNDPSRAAARNRPSIWPRGTAFETRVRSARSS